MAPGPTVRCATPRRVCSEDGEHHGGAASLEEWWMTVVSFLGFPRQGTAAGSLRGLWWAPVPSDKCHVTRLTALAWDGCGVFSSHVMGSIDVVTFFWVGTCYFPWCHVSFCALCSVCRMVWNMIGRSFRCRVPLPLTWPGAGDRSVALRLCSFPWNCWRGAWGWIGLQAHDLFPSP